MQTTSAPSAFEPGADGPLAGAPPPTPRHPFRDWLGRLLDPVTPGMAADAPRARLAPVLLIFALLATQTVLRYKAGFLAEDGWQGAHLLIGFTTALTVIGLFHGFGTLRRVRARTWVLLAASMVLLALFWYFGRMDAYHKWWRVHLHDDGPYSPIYAFMYFSVCALLFRAALPLLFARFALGLRPGDLGFAAATNPHPPTVRRIWPLYLAMFLVMVPFLVAVAQTPAFQAKYPLCREMIQPGGVISLEHLLVYQAFYFLIFVSGEGFWRGVLTFGTERDLGLYGIVLMVIPYVTAHFGKPLAETLGAIVAGSLLGFLALKHRSMWLGVALHYGVALSMDLLAIRARGLTLDL